MNRNANDKATSNLILLNGGKANTPLKSAVDFFEDELLEISVDEAVKVWNLDFISKKYKELQLIGRSLGVECENRTLGMIIREIREKQANGKSVS